MHIHQILSCHVTQDVNFEKFLLFIFNIRKSHKISSGESSLLQKLSHPPVPLGSTGQCKRCDGCQHTSPINTDEGQKVKGKNFGKNYTVGYTFQKEIYFRVCFFYSCNKVYFWKV